jgi:hypothetical protein
MKRFIIGTIGTTMQFGLLVIAGCAWFAPKEPPPKDLTLEAHTVSRGLVFDRVGGDLTGVLVPSSTPREGPQLVLRAPTGRVTAALWINGLVATVRHTTDADAPKAGTVVVSSPKGAIRLEVALEGGATFSVSEFKRVAGGASPTALGQPADSLMDLRGMYLAKIADHTGKQCGWMRVQVDARWQPGHVYTAILPGEIDGALAVAAVAQVDSVLDAVEDAAMNPYMGN